MLTPRNNARKGRRREKAIQDQEAEEEKQRLESEKIETYKQSLGKKEREQLREKVLEKISKMKDVKSDFITEQLIFATENEILKNNK